MTTIAKLRRHGYNKIADAAERNWIDPDTNDLRFGFSWSATPEGALFWICVDDGEIEEALKLHPEYRETPCLNALQRSPNFECAQQPSDLTTRLMSVITEALEKVNAKRAQQIKEVLAELGVTFQSEEEYIEFAKSDRCLITKQQIENGSHDCIFHLDGVGVAQWNDRIEIQHEGTKVTITQGR
jgi:hypothetical protein